MKYFFLFPVEFWLSFKNCRERHVLGIKECNLVKNCTYGETQKHVNFIFIQYLLRFSCPSHVPVPLSAIAVAHWILDLAMSQINAKSQDASTYATPKCKTEFAMNTWVHLWHEWLSRRYFRVSWVGRTRGIRYCWSDYEEVNQRVESHRMLMLVEMSTLPMSKG